MSDEDDRRAQIELLIDAEVLRAMAPYRTLGLTPDVLDEMEALLRLALHTHPDAQHLLRVIAPDPVLVKSDTLPNDVVEAALRAAEQKERSA